MTGKSTKPTFIDVFAGCGGLSLGLMQSGWQGLFAVEKDTFAFATLKENLLKPKRPLSYHWPTWLPRKPHSISTLLRNYRKPLDSLSIDMIVGGPPCQGFSSAGRRKAEDPRNKLSRRYIQLVDIVRPKLILLENVKGFTEDFNETNGTNRQINYASRISAALKKHYVVHSKIIDVSDFGVPQRRRRFFLVGIRKDLCSKNTDPFQLLSSFCPKFLKEHGISAGTSAKKALSDFEASRTKVMHSPDSLGFKAISHIRPRTSYQRLMHAGTVAAVSDTRLANHTPLVVARFRAIIRECHSVGRLAVSLNTKQKTKYGIKKAAIRVLNPNAVAPTITSLPDDLLHYSEPRTLTVRENARLQTFPDWFKFRGKYTTGGHLRTQRFLASLR